MPQVGFHFASPGSSRDWENHRRSAFAHRHLPHSPADTPGMILTIRALDDADAETLDLLRKY
ncbi:MAG: hypothetical protein ACOCYR_07360, partial [Erythrobacter sp.]